MNFKPMKKLFLFMMLLLASMFATTLQAQSEFTLKGQDIPMYIDGDSVIIYDGIVRVKNDSLLLVETLGGFYINERCENIYMIDKRDYVNTTYIYIMYSLEHDYQFWIKRDPVTGKILRFQYTSFKEYKTIEG